MRKLLMLCTPLAMLGLSACGTVNSAMSTHQKTTEFYRIFDIKNAPADRSVVADEVSKSLTRWVAGINESRPIPSYTTLPNNPGRFRKPQVSNNSSPLGAMMMNALAAYTVQCPDAIWIGTVTKDIAGTDGVRLTACLFQYKDGYNLDFYGTYNEKEGFTLDPFELGGKMARAVTGSADQWLEKMIADVTSGIRDDLKAEVTFKEGYPKPEGQPWWSMTKAE